MFDRNSRYHGLEQGTLELTDSDGRVRQLPYVRRRFIPKRPTHSPAASHTVGQGERLDLIANRYLGDPTLFWHLVDGTDAVDPADLTDEPGTVVDIYLPGMGI